MKIKLSILSILIILLIPLIGLLIINKDLVRGEGHYKASEKSHWFVLHRKSAMEFLYYGIPGDVNHSKIVRKFQVKTGNPLISPTPLPSILGKEYWILNHKESSMENPDTAPYFLRLDVPTDENWPYGPMPYEECIDITTGKKIQCDWQLPGYFGLHGIGGNQEKLSSTDPGSSGCIRHRDEDISYLYHLLTPEAEEIRYYIKDI